MIIKLASSAAVNVMKKYKIMDIYMVFMSMHRMSHAISVRSVLQKNSNLFMISDRKIYCASCKSAKWY